MVVIDFIHRYFLQGSFYLKTYCTKVECQNQNSKKMIRPEDLTEEQNSYVIEKEIPRAGNLT